MLNISKDEKRYTEIELDLNKKLAYEKGRASIVEELESLNTEIEEIRDWVGYGTKRYFSDVEVHSIINKRISELKGE